MTEKDGQLSQESMFGQSLINVLTQQRNEAQNRAAEAEARMTATAAVLATTKAELAALKAKHEKKSRKKG